MVSNRKLRAVSDARRIIFPSSRESVTHTRNVASGVPGGYFPPAGIPDGVILVLEMTMMESTPRSMLVALVTVSATFHSVHWAWQSASVESKNCGAVKSGSGGCAVKQIVSWLTLFAQSVKV